MAIPPIISNLPFFRGFKSNSNGAGNAAANAASPAATGGDTLQISDAAQKKLAAAQVLTAEDPAKINSVTSQIKQYLEQNPVSLGLNPAFE